MSSGHYASVDKKLTTEVYFYLKLEMADTNDYEDDKEVSYTREIHVYYSQVTLSHVR